MPRTMHPSREELADVIKLATDLTDPGHPDSVEQLASCADAQARAPLLRLCAAEARRQKECVRRMAAINERLTEQNKLLTGEPLIEAVFIRAAENDKAVVFARGHRQQVAVDAGVVARALKPGDGVLLAKGGAAIIGRCAASLNGCVVAGFVRWAGARMLVEFGAGQKELLEVPPGALEDPAVAGIEAGSEVLCHGEARIFLELLPKAAGDHFSILKEPPSVSGSDMGGMEDLYQRIKTTLCACLLHGDSARRFGLSARPGVLLAGPPGVGKTLIAKRLAAELKAGHGNCVFASVKPGEFASKWYGEAEARVRAAFKHLNTQAARGLVVLYLDEVECLGRTRGSAPGGVHDDKVLACVLAELDGLQSLSNVAVIASTNRVEMLDPAFVERIGGSIIHVPRPDARTAAEMLKVHLPEHMPFSPNGVERHVTRSALIETAVALLYADNAPASAIAKVTFTDGKQRVVLARELVSGRLLASLADAAKRRAHDRFIQDGGGGIRVEDIEWAAHETAERMRRLLTRENIHHYLTDLPQTTQVLSVDPVMPPGAAEGPPLIVPRPIQDDDRIIQLLDPESQP